MDGAEEFKKMEKMAEAIKKVGHLFTFDNLKFPPLPGLYPDPERKFKEIRDLECRKSDVFLCTYPKAGTHWTFEILSMLIKQSATYNLFSMNDAFLDATENKDDFNKRKSPRLFITHLPYRYLPLQLREGTGRMINVLRNPKDLHVSLHEFRKGKTLVSRNTKWEEFFENTVIGKDVRYETWFNYYKEWEKAFRSKNILPVYYHQMKIILIKYIKIGSWVLFSDNRVTLENHYKNLTENVLKIANFLDLFCSNGFAGEITRMCEFAEMKKNKSDLTKALNATGTTPLYRKGQEGDWKHVFTVAQNERFDAFYAEQMKDSNLKFII